MYFRMCAKSLVQYRKFAAELATLDYFAHNYDTAFERAEQAAVEPVIFAGMCLEASLFDLGACLFGQGFAEHTDKLDPIGKYVVIAQYIDRKPPDAASITLQSLQALVTARNKLVHHKSHSALEEDWTQILNRAKKTHKQHLAGIAASFRALVLLSLHFDGDIFEELRILPSFKKPEYWQSLVPSELHEDVRWCIDASRKEAQGTSASIDALYLPPDRR